jgi:hypothetical protein
MTGQALPFVPATRNVTKALERVRIAPVPSRFTHGFLCTLDLAGGSARPVIPFMHDVGLLDAEGVPTERYLRFCDPTRSSAAAFEALREGFRALYEVDPRVHNAESSEIERIIGIACGGMDSATQAAIRRSFESLRSFADCDETDRDTGFRPVETGLADPIARNRRCQAIAGLVLLIAAATYLRTKSSCRNTGT